MSAEHRRFTAAAHSFSDNSIPLKNCCLQLSIDLKELDSPEELYPLKDALERAKRRVDQSTGIREALEAEVSLCHICSATNALQAAACVDPTSSLPSA